MKNAPCTPLSSDEEAALLSAFPACLSPEEETDAAQLFRPYIFYKTLPNRGRNCYCTSCRKHFYVSRKGHAAFFAASHKGTGSSYMFREPRMKAACPECGAESEIISAGKFRNFKTLSEYELVARLSVYDGWLLVQSGVVVRDFGRDDSGVTESRRFHEFRRFVFKPGRRDEWQLRGQFTVSGYQYVCHISVSDFLSKSNYSYRSMESFSWTRQKSVGEAHYPAPYQAAAYCILNPGAIAQSDMRYCQFFLWHEWEYGELQGHYYANMCLYLSEYTRRPQIEMLVKLGYEQVVSDLVIRGKTHRDALNWKANNPKDFFGMGKADFLAFRDSELTFQDLSNFRELRRRGLVRDMREYAGFQREFANFDTFGKACLAAGVTMRRGANYLLECSFRTAASMPTCATLWLDYLEAAKKLEYDLAREDVTMPRNPPERHDNATQTVSIEVDKKAHARYRVLYKDLQRRYEYSADGLCVCVPICTADIVAEGKALQHCVGGYAARHMEGQTVILFLRKADTPAVPYVTVEIAPDNNPAKITLRQIHGFKNDRGAESPRQTHAAFIDKWLAWVHAGSPRDSTGRPIMEGVDVWTD